MKNKPVLMTIKKEYIDRTEEALDKGLIDKYRPYYMEVNVLKNYKVFIPIRSNCTNSPCYIPIHNDLPRIRKNPGLDCNKLIIIKDTKATTYTSICTVSINNDVYSDIEEKEAKIEKECISFLKLYKEILIKEKSGKLLSNYEKKTRRYSTLKNYTNIIMNLEQQIKKDTSSIKVTVHTL